MHRISVLDYGYVELVETWGSDAAIVEAARESTGKGFLGWEPGTCPGCEGSGSLEGDECFCCDGRGHHPGDDKFLRFLRRSRHDGPLEFAGMVIRAQAPIFVFREWHRHRTQSFNEASARYAPLPHVNYVPSVERLMMSGGKNRQASGIKGAPDMTESTALAAVFEMVASYDRLQKAYTDMLEVGVPKELARLVLPVGRYSRMRASSNLRNWLHFLGLRLDESAQWEIRQYAQAVHSLLTSAFPRTMQLFDEGR